jgi:hypothetical protein
MHSLKRFVVAAVATLLVVPAAAHVRLINPNNGNKLFWSVPSSISIVISSTPSDNITNGSTTTALRNAIAAWNADTQTTATLVENTSALQRARSDWEANDVHLIVFDETDDSGYFPFGSGTVALTPVWFNSSGSIVDADILFNGSGFDFTTSAQFASFDVQDVGAHELGHLLGLDHSGWAGATMYPYVDTSVILHRSLSRDDVLGLRDAYPAQAFATISGTVRRASNNSLVLGAHVVARDSNGRSAAAALTDDDGDFVLRALAADTYEIYASPLDFPVSAGNLGSGHTVQTDFESTIFGSYAVTASQSLSIGDVLVDPDVALRLGGNADPYPLRCPAGATAAHLLRGAGLTAGSTLTASDPNVTLSNISWLTNQVQVDVDVLPGAAAGHFDVMVTNTLGHTSILTAPFEVTTPTPVVTTVAPPAGSRNGGTALTITGSNFAAGARVVIGPNIYVDGEIGGATVVDASTITLTTAAMTAGTYDVVAIDATGVEGRKINAFQAAMLPSIDSLFPAVGSAAGGTLLSIVGAEFDPAAVVRIDGVQQTQVTVVSATSIEILTNAGAPGGPYVVEVENPGGDVATSAFAYVGSADPAFTSIAPAVGSANGGNTVVISGSNFTANTTVLFGAAAETGLGGTAATSVVFVDANTLEVVTPSHAAGMHNVLVQDNVSGQAVIAEAAFTFQSSGGGGGGGCSVVPMQGPRSFGDALSNVIWLALSFAVLASEAWRRNRRVPVPVRKSARR